MTKFGLLNVTDSFQLVILPVLDDLTTYSNATAETQAAIMQCYADTLTINFEIRNNQSCQAPELSLMTELYGGAVGQYDYDN